MKLTPKEIEELYDRYSKRLFHTSLRIVGNSMDAEEVVNDTLLKITRCNETFTEEQQKEAWLVKVCIRASIDYIRKQKNRSVFISEFKEEIKNETEIESGISDYLSDNSSEISEKISAIKNTVNTLADGYRLILTLNMFEGYDYAEISEITGIKESSVRSQYIRAKAKLLEKLKN